jgi:hypothetical protein
MFKKKAAQKIKKHILFSIFFLNLVFYEMMWKNMVQPDRPQMAMLHGACALHAG